MSWTDTSNGALTRSAGVCRKRIGLRDAGVHAFPVAADGAARG